MLSRLFLVFLFFVCAAHTSAQEYNYQHYDLKNGLSGLTVYSIAQDKDGFLWFGTETGLSRFDGSNFKNFTTADGLPDNEVLKLYVDSKNRVWILSFTNSVCYYQNGLIHSSKNDSMLAQLKFTYEPHSVCEDAKGNIAIIEKDMLHVINSNGKVYKYDSFNGNGIFPLSTGINEKGNIAIYATIKNGFDNCGIFELDKQKLDLSFQALSNTTMLTSYLSFLVNKQLMAFREENKIHVQIKDEEFESVFDVPEYFIGFSYLCDTLFTINCNNNVLLYDVKQRKVINRFTLDKLINSCFLDNEGNYWFATAGYGVYRLASLAFKNYNLIFQNNFLPVYAILAYGDSLLVGTNRSLLWTVDMKNNILASRKINSEISEGRISAIIRNPDNLIIGTDGLDYIYKNNEIKKMMPGLSIKNIYPYKNKILISSNRCVVEKDRYDPAIIDTIWWQRATCAYKFDSFYYIGTLSGLYKINEKKQSNFLGKTEPLLSSRISGIVQSRDTLWIATYGNGIVGYSKNKICAHITEKEGLTSNMCRVLYLYNGSLWIGTDKGLNRIILSDISGKISKFTSKDGLNCDIINCLLVEKDTVVYIGTPYGLVLFNPSNVNNNSIAFLNVNSVSSKKYKWNGKDTMIDIEAGDNRFSVDFSCVSFKSQGNITYHYRLSGLDKNWHTTKENIIDYASLPAGDYTFQLYAVNAFEKKSNTVIIKFTIDKFFYQQTWFILLISVLVLLLVWYWVRKRIAKIKKDEKQKLVTQKRLTELEQMAFKSQMNPHFIFNCLNSIQQYIFDRNVIDANKFVTDFSSLIRQTLYISSKKIISLQEEVKYLDTYLKLEHARFDENFDYEILVAPELTSEDIYLPPLLMQPYIENSIRHGIRNLKNKRGKLLAQFYIQNDYLFCVAEDNGIGRKAAERMKDKNAIEYQSKGMSLIRQRIDALNSETTKKIKITIEDVYPEEEDTGTRIIIQIPLDTDWI